MEIDRIYLKGLSKELGRSEVSVILGARQVGKSTLMRRLEVEARSRGHTTAFFDLEQPAGLQSLSGDNQTVIQKLAEAADVVFIDEFHYLKNASKIFKAIYDSKRRVKIVASGSSSLEIHKHLKESLAGRFQKTVIYPLLIHEWDQTQGFKCDDYLQWGGMPGLLNTSEAEYRVKLLENIVSTYITKDIKGLLKEENIRAFNSLLYLLAQSQGSVAVSSNLARETGLSESTVSRYLELMSQTHVLYPVLSYSSNLANELKKSKKYFLFDLGIRNLLLKDFRPAADREDKGALIESAVLLHLIPQVKPNMELRFWRTKKQDEVDFVMVKNRIPAPIEVKSGLSEPRIPKGLLQFMAHYPKAPFGIVYNASLETTVKFENRPVYFKHWSDAASVDWLQDIF